MSSQSWQALVKNSMEEVEHELCHFVHLNVRGCDGEWHQKAYNLCERHTHTHYNKYSQCCDNHTNKNVKQNIQQDSKEGMSNNAWWKALPRVLAGRDW